MKKNKMANCYDPLNHTKACDYCKMIETNSQVVACKYALVFFYARKPFFSLWIDGKNGVTKSFIDFYLDCYSELLPKYRKSFNWLAKYYFKTAEKILYKFTPEGELVKDYEEGKITDSAGD